MDGTLSQPDSDQSRSVGAGDAAQFAIPAENMTRLIRVMERISKRAKKLGFPPVTYVLGKPFVRQVPNIADGEVVGDRYIEVYPVTVEGQQPVLADWRFLGKIEHITGTTENIVKGNVPQQYFACEPDCDHCGKKRARSETFILSHNDTQEIKQVGRSCLKDFFNGDNPMLHASMLQLLFDAKEELQHLEECECSGGGFELFKSVEILTRTAAEIRVNGWVSSAKAEEQKCLSTAQIIRQSFFGRKNDLPDIEKDDIDQADRIIAWLKSDEILVRKADSTYWHNLCVMAEAGFAGRKNIGLLASAACAYVKHLAHKVHLEALSTSEYVGTPDQKIADFPVTVTAKIFIQDNFNGKTLHKFSDEHGNQLAWFASGNSPAKVGDRVHINATVKEHSEYRECKQTTLLRVTTNEDRVFAAVIDKKGAKALRKALVSPSNLDHLNINSKMTSLMVAARDGHAEIVRMLLDAGASVDMQDEWGRTAAFFAALHADLRTLEVLQDHGADMDQRCLANYTASDELEEGRLQLRKDVAKFQDKCSDLYGRCQAVEATWNYDTEFELAKLGDRHQWIDWYIEECAQMENEGKGALVESLASGDIETPVVILMRDGTPYIWDGRRRIGAAMRAGNEIIPAFVGRHDPVLENITAPVAGPMLEISL